MDNQECLSCRYAGSCGIQIAYATLKEIAGMVDESICDVGLARKALEARDPICHGYQQIKDARND